MAEGKRDQNMVVTLMGVTDNGSMTPVNLVVDPTTGRLKVSAVIASGSLTSLNALTAADQLFARTNDTNVTLTITSLVDTHTFALGWSGTLAVARGGTGSGTAAGAATNLGLGTGDSPQFTAINLGHASDTTITRVSAGVIAVEGVNVLLATAIGTTVQAYDATLASIAALGTAADRVAYTTGVDTWAETPLTSFGRSLIDDANASDARTTLGLVIGTHVQAYDADLTTWASLTPSAFFQTLVDDADAATFRTTLGVGTGDSPQFTAINLGHASDTTITRTGAGDIAIEGNAVYRAGGTDVPVTDGGTGASTAAAAATNLGLGTGDSPQFTGVNVGHASDTTITRDAAGVIAVEGNRVTMANNYILIQDQKAQNTAAGGFTSGAWRTRVLNTEVSDVGGWATLSSNQITLLAGTYRFRGVCPAYECARHQCRLQNVTDGTTVAYGSSNYNGTGDATMNNSEVVGRFTIAASKTFELQHQCQTTRATDGLGIEANFGTEVYASIEFWRE